MSFGTSYARTSRPLVLGRSCAIVTGHHLATQTGMEVLRAGGNAVDAAISAAAALAVLKPDACGLGSDLFLVAYDAASRETHALNASGPAPALVTLDQFRDGIPADGLIAATVPGAVDGWQRALDRFGRRTLAEALRPAIGFAEGMPVSAFFADTLTTSAARARRFATTAAIFYPDGTPPAPGCVLAQSDLARTLRAIARDGTAAFYRGEFAHALDAHARDCGALLRLPDLVGYTAEWKPALCGAYRNHEIFGCPPVSMGIATLEALQILDRFDIGGLRPDGADAIHLHVEALRRALSDVRQTIGDPGVQGDVPAQRLLDRAHAAACAAEIEASSRASGPAVTGATGGETSYIGVIDADGNAVSLLQSVFNVFGCGEVVRGTGVLMNNRLTGFSRDPASPNALAPGKRAMNTLNPFIARTPDGRMMTFGTPGGPAQTFTNVLLAMRAIDFGIDLQTAVDAPRWFVTGDNRLQIEEGLEPSVYAKLAARGHVLDRVPRASAALGGAGMVRINAHGVLEAAADPRRESYAQAR